MSKWHMSCPSMRVMHMSWLRVFTSANTAHLGHRGGHEREPSVVRSEKYAARRGSVSDGRRMIPACFSHALQRGSSRIGMHFLLTFQGVMLIRKTRNQLTKSGGMCICLIGPQYARATT